jgi:hypothetical protein
MTCHPERKGPQTLFSSGVPKERSLLFGVEVGGGESKDLHLYFRDFHNELLTHGTSARFEGRLASQPRAIA